MKYLLIILLFLPLPIFSQCMNQDIVVMVDVSSSVMSYQQDMENGVRAIVDKFEIKFDKVNFGFVEFGSEAIITLPLISDEELIYDYIDHISKSNKLGSTNMSDALRISHDMLNNSERVMNDKVLIIVSDGEPDNVYLAQYFAQNIKQNVPPIKICSIIIKPIRDKYDGTRVSFLRRIASDMCFTVTDFNKIVEDINKLNFCF